MAEGSPDARTEVDGAAPAGVDVGRRRFFRQLAADVFQATATVVGAANALQQQSIQAASAILDPDAIATELAADQDAAALGDRPARGFRTAFRLDTDRLILVDQRQLPARIAEIECRTGADVAWAIREMVVRGAPAIGQAAAYGLALTARRAIELKPFARRATIRAAATALRDARPTAVNLGWAVDRMLARMEAVGSLQDDGSIIADALWLEADAICAEATRDHSLLAEHGLARLPVPVDRPLRVLTHCNTGPLAAGQFGTALGVVQAAVHAGRQIHVYVDETRPYLQGARLTAWELEQAGVPYTLIADVAAGALLASGTIDAVLVGADRVAANGDTANKIGTYPLAALAARHRVPFYVCAPISSVDLETPDGQAIPIEERSPSEVLAFGGVRIAPPGATVWNPAFDVTPAELISAVVTEEGALVAPFGPALAAAVEAKRARSASAVNA
ncbi:MAG: methylthioribose-phosphate isomerase [Chloroflexota bacterium]|jgi:methylthioribose-1-phosphate isomerase|nr:methylthioribose-phosphate isomerase [Chloroflexota bacterium]